MHKYKVTFVNSRPKEIQATRVIPDNGFFMFYTYEPGAIFQASKLVACFPFHEIRSVECIEREVDA